MRGFIFSVDMLYGTLVVILLFSILLHATVPAVSPQQQLLQIQAKDGVMVWFYSTPIQYSSDAPVLTACPDPVDTSCACDLGFRPRVDTIPLDPSQPGSWVTQTVCVVAP